VKLSEWLEQQPFWGGVHEYARQRAKAALEELAPFGRPIDEAMADPIVFGDASPRARALGGLSVTVWAALPAGLATVVVTADPPADSTIKMSVQSWPSIATSLHLDSEGDAREPHAATLMAGPERIESKPNDRAELVALFLECARMVSSGGEPVRSP
jgi:hypothetical protein